VQREGGGEGGARVRECMRECTVCQQEMRESGYQQVINKCVSADTNK
jgi:hypothetical protein